MAVVVARAPTVSILHEARTGAWRVVVATFVTLGLAYGFWYAYSVFLVAFLRDFGWSRSVVAGAFSVLVVVHGVSGPLLGWLVERFGARAVIASGGALLAGLLLLGAHVDAVWQLYTLAFACVALSVGFLALAGAYPHTLLPYGYAVLIGIGYAVTAPLTPAIASDLFGGPRFARLFGILHLMNSLGGAIGAWLAGWLFDATGSYALALPIAAGMALLAPGLLWFVAPRHPNPPPRPA